MFEKLVALARAEAWTAAGHEVVDGTLPDTPVEDVAMSLAQMWVEDARARGVGMGARRAIRLITIYALAFLDGVEAFQAA